MASVREIARLAGVSTSTVSRALNNDPAVNGATREKVLAVANQSGYVASVGRLVTTNVGFVYAGGETTLGSTFDSALLSGVVRGLEQPKFDVVVINLQRDKSQDENYSQFFRRKGLRGVLVRTAASTRDVCRSIADEHFPMLVVSERFDDENVSFIDCDSHRESIQAMEYLISLGHRRIAFGMHTVPDSNHIDRFAGYKKALEAHGIPYDEKLIFRQNASFSGGASAVKMMMTMAVPPTAVYFADPLLSVGAINVAHETGIRIPENLAVVGFDDADIRHSVYPTMTAVCQDAARLGYEAALELTRMIRENGGTRIQRILPTFLEVNESTGPPGGASVRVPENGSWTPVSPGMTEVHES
jgi:DNA-binding LacI/PurR family transcriptional regulator